MLALARGRRKLYIAGAHFMHPPSGVFWLIHWNCVCVVLVLSGLILRFSAPQNVTTWFAPLVVTCLVKFKLRKSLGVRFQNPNVFANSAPVICVTHSLGHFEFNVQRSLESVRHICQSSFTFISDDQFLNLISVVDCSTQGVLYVPSWKLCCSRFVLILVNML